MTRVCAFVLTRNRRELLVECLAALAAQSRPPDRIVVLDNASEDGTEELLRERGWLSRDDVLYRRAPANLGSAGGYGAGLRLALEQQPDWIWLMDDDAEPRAGALAGLLGAPPARDPAVAGLAPAVVHPDGSIDGHHRCSLRGLVVPLPARAYRVGTYATVDCASWVGHLVRADAARAAGDPRTEFFLMYDDAEWSLRLRRHGRIALVPEAEVVHKLPIGGRTQTVRSRAWNRILRTGHASTPAESFWRSLYGIRNFMFLRREHGGIGRAEFALLTGAYIVKSLLYDPQPLRRVPWIVRFARKGRAGDFSGPGPDEISRAVSRPRAADRPAAAGVAPASADGARRSPPTS